MKWSRGKGRSSRDGALGQGPAPCRPVRQVQCHLFGESSFVGTQLCYMFRYCFWVRLCYRGATLWVLGTKTQWLTKSEILTVWPFAEKVLQSLLWEFGSPEGGTLSKTEHLWMNGSEAHSIEWEGTTTHTDREPGCTGKPGAKGKREFFFERQYKWQCHVLSRGQVRQRLQSRLNLAALSA